MTFSMKCMKGPPPARVHHAGYLPDCEMESGVSELVGDGGCTWGRSQAMRHGKFGLQTEVRKMNARDEQARLLAMPAQTVSLAERAKNKVESDAAVVALRAAEKLVLDELLSWERSGCVVGVVELYEARREAMARARRR